MRRFSNDDTEGAAQWALIDTAIRSGLTAALDPYYEWELDDSGTLSEIRDEIAPLFEDIDGVDPSRIVWGELVDWVANGGLVVEP